MTDDRETRLDRACADYLRAADAGRPPEREAWLAAHPDLASDLAAFLDGFSSVEGLLAPLRDDADATVDRPATVTAPDAPTFPDGYELLAPIAAGGMGVVYRARQVALNREVALKMIRAAALAGDSAVQRFKLEAEAAAGFDHPHIVPVYQVGVTAGGQPFFSMKLIDGRTLSEWLAARRPTTDASLREAVRLMSAVCRAVHYAHQRGFLHRDLKPGNILVDAAGAPHVTDFGLAKRIGERPSDGQLTEAGGLVGTLAYMAPEQAGGGERLTTAADVYSLGAILYLILTGRPLRPDPVKELMSGTLGRTPPSLRAIAPDVERDLEAVCLKCLAEQPAARFGSAEALADELDRWADGRPIRTRPPRPTRRLWLWVRRRPRSAALVALAAALLVVGVGLVTWKWRDEAAARREAQIEGARSAAAVARSLMEPEADGDSRELGTAALWWVRSFEQAPADEHELRDTARGNLSALAGRLHTLSKVKAGAPPALTSGPVTVNGPDGWRANADGHFVRVSKNGQSVGDPLPHADVVRAVVFSPTGDTIVSGGDDHTARVWEFVKGEGVWREVATVEHQEYVRAITFSPDGRLLATGGADGAAQVWDTVSFRRVGQRLPHAGWVERVSFSADGGTLTTTTADGTQRVWVISAAARAERCCDLGADVYAVTPTPDEAGVYAGTKKGVFHLDAATLSRPSKPLFTDKTWAVGWSGKHLVAGGPIDQTGWFGVYSFADNRLTRHEVTEPVRSVVGTPDGSRALFTTATTTTGGLWEWGVDQRPQPLRHGEPTWAVARDTRRYVTSTGDGHLRGWRNDTHTPDVFTLDHPPRSVSLAFFPDGGRLAAADTDGFVRVWDTTSGGAKWGHDHRGAAWAVAVSPDGKLVASGGRDRCVRLWEADTGRAVGPPLPHKAVVWAVAFSPDGRWVWSGSEDGTVRRRPAPETRLEGPNDHLRRWAERATGQTLEGDRPHVLMADGWAER